jgi:sugar fermentation stimulation protein
MLLHQLSTLTEGIVVKRPSKYIKTPYVADIQINITNKNKTIKLVEEIQGHTPSLGCCGLVDTNAKVLLTESTSNNVKCSHTVQLSVTNDQIVIGVNPKLAEIITENALKNNCLKSLQNIKSYKREVAIYIEGKVDSRFDFSGIDSNGIPFIMEVKTSPLEKNGISYFPDGFRKKVTDTISPRALKHIQELTLIKKETNVRCLMCYVIQRSDTHEFMPSPADPFYKKAFYEAIKAGVEIITLQVDWSIDGKATFIRDDLPISCE